MLRAAACLVILICACERAAPPPPTPPPTPPSPAGPRLALVTVYDPTPPVGVASHAEIRLRDARTGALIRAFADPCQTYGRTVVGSPAGDALFEGCADAHEITRIPLTGGAPSVIGHAEAPGMIVSGDGELVWAFTTHEAPGPLFVILHADGSAPTEGSAAELGLPASTADGLAYTTSNDDLLHRTRSTPTGVITTTAPLPASVAHESVYDLFNSIVPNAPVVVDRGHDGKHWIARADASGRWVDLAPFAGLAVETFSAVTATDVVYLEQSGSTATRVMRVSLTPGAPPTVVVDLPERSHLLPEAFDPAGRFVVARTVTIGDRTWSDDRTCIDLATGRPVGHYALSPDETPAAALVMLSR